MMRTGAMAIVATAWMLCAPCVRADDTNAALSAPSQAQIEPGAEEIEAAELAAANQGGSHLHQADAHGAEGRSDAEAAAATPPTEQSWGSYNAPEFRSRPRAGLVGEVPAEMTSLAMTSASTRRTAQPEGTISQVLAGLALGAVVVTLLLAARMSRLKRADGRSVRAFTLGTKMVLGLGAITSATIGVGSLAYHAQSQIARGGREVEVILEQQRLAATLNAQTHSLRSAVAEFLNDPTDERYDRVDAALGSLKGAAALLERDEVNNKTSSAIAQVDAAYAALFTATKRAVALHDERLDVLETQVLPTAKHITDVLAALEKVAQSTDLAHAVAQADAACQSARVAFHMYLRTNEHADYEHAKSMTLELNAVLDAASSGSSGGQAAAIAECQGAARFWVDRLERMYQISNGHNDEASHIGWPRAIAAVDASVTAVEVALANQYAETATLNAKAASGTRWMLMGAIAGLVALSVGVGMVLLKSTTGGLETVVSVLVRVAKGDLTMSPLNSAAQDEIGELSRAADSMVAGVRDVLTEVATSTQDVSAAATEIAASAEEMSGSVGEVARQAQEAAKAAESAGGSARAGGEVVGKTVESMRKIHSSVEATARNIAELGEKSEQIGRIIEVINDIAEQTNLLALNAAIESARAGVHGRGFAVVADEVRKLAERTTKATEEVTSSIEAIQGQTEQAVHAMMEGTTLVGGGVNYAGEAKANLESIVGGASTVTAMIRAITAAGEEAGAGASQSAAAAGQLSARAEELRVMVGRFKVKN